MNTKKLIVFLLWAFIPMIAVGLVMNSIGATTSSIDVNGTTVDTASVLNGLIMAAGSMLIPLLAVIFTQLIFKEPVLKGLDIKFNIKLSWFIAWLIIPVIIFAILGITLLMPGARWTPDSETIQTAMAQMPAGIGVWGVIAITVVSGLFAGITVNALFAFGEEIAWRGYLLKLFQGKKFLTTALYIGIIWGLWHAPIILNGHNYPLHPVAGVFMMIAVCLSMTPALMYFRMKSGSVIVPAIMHGTINATAGITLFVITPKNDLLYGAAGLAGIITFLLFDIGLYIYDRYISKDKIFLSLL
ncbi:MAG: CPBP family intramembrane metalloprotease [Bacteroidaceae bacterium]|nr:CPBP family intramembrane metalloprotease [Bacteroidaceae bacterium]